jgi:hypothetical protein
MVAAVRALATGGFVMVVGALGGCAWSVEQVQEGSSASPLAAATVTPSEHELVIAGVDYDPPIDKSGTVNADGGVTLLVALANRGMVAERDVRVTARLADPQLPPSYADLLVDSVTVPSLKRGEVRQVRFTHLTDVPIRDRYLLTVQVDRVAGETDIRDNVRSYNIALQRGN